jgi:hypothetical protein
MFNIGPDRPDVKDIFERVQKCRVILSRKDGEGSQIAPMFVS